MNEIDELLRDLIVNPQVAPGAVAGVATWSGTEWSYHVGHAGVADHFTREPVSNRTWYDLASITKSIVAVALARAVELKRLSWADELGTYLPFVQGRASARASLLSLLSHTSGLQAHIPLFEPLLAGERVDKRQALVRAAEAMRPDLNVHATTDRPRLEPYPALYSDLGYILAGEMLRQACATSLDTWLGGELERLGLPEIASASWFETRGVDVSRVAPTEVMPYRGGLVRAQVHDDNAWALHQYECSGHAGLFGTCEGVLRFGTLMLDLQAGRSRLLAADVVTELLRPREGASLRAGFDGKSASGSVIGQVMGARTFGHLGFTGTSYFCDPDAQCVVSLLTNRVCPSRGNVKIREARPRVHDALAEMATRLTPPFARDRGA